MHHHCHRNNRTNYHQSHQPGECPQRTPWLPLAVKPADYFIATGKERQHSASLSREYVVCAVIGNLPAEYASLLRLYTYPLGGIKLLRCEEDLAR